MKLFVALLVLLVVISGATPHALANAQPYKKQLQQREAHRIPSASSSRQHEAIRIACVGDSLTQIGHASDYAHSYPSQLQVMLDATRGKGKYIVLNLGESGKTLNRASNFSYWNSVDYWSLTHRRWDIVILMLGSNDAATMDGGLYGGNEHWPRSCDNATSESLDSCPFAVDYKAMLDTIKGRGTTAAGPDIYIMIPPPVMRQWAYYMNQTIVNHILPRLIPSIFQASKANVDGIIDAYSAFGGVLDWRSKFPDNCILNSSWKPCDLYCDRQSCDDVHPNNAGCRHLAEVVYENILGSLPPTVKRAREYDVEPALVRKFAQPSWAVGVLAMLSCSIFFGVLARRARSKSQTDCEQQVNNENELLVRCRDIENRHCPVTRSLYLL